MSSYQPQELDIFARAFDRALHAASPPPSQHEEAKAILMTGILDAAERGVRDEIILTDAALAALALYDDRGLPAVMRTLPL
jgi:hypothetical protein